MKATKARASLAAALAGAVVAGGAAVGMAAIPNSDGTISGCFKTSSGELRVIDAGTESCKNGESAIQWNQAGPPGPQGPKGDPGPAGSPGPAGDNIFAIVSTSFNGSTAFLGNHVLAADVLFEPDVVTKVTFDRAVNLCAVVGTGRGESIDLLRVDDDPLDFHSVLVTTKRNGVDTLGDFSLFVAC